MFNRIKYLCLIILIASCQNTPNQRTEVPSEIKDLFDDYITAWSDGDIDAIASNLYGIPCIFYQPDDVIVLNTKDDIRAFLTDTFEQLDKNDYGHSILNGWEHVRISEGIALVEIHFTRYMKDGSEMGSSKRTASYVLRKEGNRPYKIFSIIAHSPLTE